MKKPGLTFGSRGFAALAGAALVFGAALTSSAQTLKATYQFGNSLAADEGGVPALTATDPLGANAFLSTTVFGQSRTVYATNGNGSPVGQQAGLTFDNSGGLLTNSNYSVEMVFSFSATSGWRRIIDVQNRQSDNGFYVDPSGQLDVFPVAGGAPISANTFHHVVLTDAGGATVKAYLDGSLAFTASTSVMNVNNAANVINFYLDNVVGGGQGEYTNAQTALIRLYDGVLSDSQVSALAANPFAAQDVPEPGTWALLAGLSGVGGLGLMRRASHGRHSGK